jgi:hypothetical protein
MTIFYAKTTNAFYDPSINTEIPSDAVEITQEDYQSLMLAQQTGQVIQANSQGYPEAVNPPAPTPIEVQSVNKANAVALLNQTDWATIPDVANPSLSNPYLSNVAEFIAYRNQVRLVAINPPTTVITFPTQPTAQWTTV